MTMEVKESEFEWLKSRDTGISSLTIFEVMTGINLRPGILIHPDLPYDPSDFGRCYRLLNKFPEWRVRLPEVAKLYPTWSGLIDNWAELTTLYEEELQNESGRAPKLYARMQEILNKRSK